MLDYKANDRITAPVVRLIDEQGKFLGAMPTSEALRIAREREFDLVEVSPKEDPPVSRLLDFGTFKYQKAKEQRVQKAHAKKVEVKGIRLSVKIGQHDVEVRLAKALEFLADGDKLKLEIILRGREKAHGELATERINEFITLIEKTYQLYIEQPVTRQGGNVSAIVGRKS